jgi:hypothetical protein
MSVTFNIRDEAGWQLIPELLQHRDDPRVSFWPFLAAKWRQA